MITDETGTEIRPTQLHVPFRDYDELLKENKRLRMVLNDMLKTFDRNLPIDSIGWSVCHTAREVLITTRRR